MKINSIGIVRISTEEYNELRDFQNSVMNSDAIEVSGWNCRYYIKEPKLREDIKRRAEAMAKSDKLNHAKFFEMRENLEKLGKMNIFEFIKWKRKNR